MAWPVRAVEAGQPPAPPHPVPDPLAPLTGTPARLVRGVAGLVITAGLRCLVRLDDSGVPHDLAVGRRPLLVTNHRSPLDYFIVVAACRARGVWPSMFAREDFFDRPLARWVLRALALIPASRGRRAPRALERAGRLLESGQVVVIAAEGRLVPAEDRPDGVGPVRGGTGRLAEAGADLTVLTIAGASRAWAPGQRGPHLPLPWRRPVVTLRARRLGAGPMPAGQATAAARTTMVDLLSGLPET